tara:strand:- start:27 stop:272 length:246 start_codon:yes stop_codon:yes gene_type:complete
LEVDDWNARWVRALSIHGICRVVIMSNEKADVNRTTKAREMFGRGPRSLRGGGQRGQHIERSEDGDADGKRRVFGGLIAYE